MSQYAFYFDASACSGCKACQIACKDKHDLEVGRLWRRVYEVTGGGWQPVDSSPNPVWENSVFAYNLSLSCNHCEDPLCRTVCPAGAITKRPDGIVLIETEKCLGCGYCAWACPYGAPQYDAAAGHMTKCTFCADLIDQGRPPACVSACPMRALEFGDRTELEQRAALEQRAGLAGAEPPVFPLPDPSLTRPALLVRPHPDSDRAASGNAWVANREEV